MLQERVADLAKYVEPDRVRREVYTDPDIFELEMQRIHERVWIYCGHESQVPKAGDYYTVQIARQPMLMVRAADGKIHVLYNRCPHRGNMMCGDRKGNAGDFFRCSYHAWTFQHDGKVRSIPMMESGYAGTRYGKDNPDCSMKRAARVENYRGFVFASLAKDGPTLAEFLGASKVAFDDMCDRAPEGDDRQAGRLPDAQLPARPLHHHRLHGVAAAGSRHARLRQDHDPEVRAAALRGDRRGQHPPRADLSGSFGAVAAPAVARGAA